MDSVILQGGGDHARVVLDSLLAQGYNVKALFDPKYNDSLFGVKQLGEYSHQFEPEAKAIVAIGDNALRKRVVALTKHRFINTLHPSAVVSQFSAMGIGNMILHRSVVQAQTTIGNHVILNTGAQVDHDCKIGDYVHIGPGVILCGTVTVGEGAFIGAGSVVIPGIKIGAWSVVGAGSVVIKDIPDFSLVVGNPGRILKNLKP
jgi:sugar O-acyltransferase (sialic acid O-acetyltransferase NeuD family)